MTVKIFLKLSLVCFIIATALSLTMVCVSVIEGNAENIFMFSAYLFADLICGSIVYYGLKVIE